MNSKLPVDILGRIWDISDIDKDGYLDRDEFAVVRCWYTHVYFVLYCFTPAATCVINILCMQHFINKQIVYQVACSPV